MASKRLAKKKAKQKALQAVQAVPQTAKAKEPKIVVVKAKEETSAAKEPVNAEIKVEVKKEGKTVAMKKPNIYIQYQQNEIEEQMIINKIKEAWKTAGNLMKDLDEMTVYIKPEEGKAYYIINGSVNGEVALF